MNTKIQWQFARGALLFVSMSLAHAGPKEVSTPREAIPPNIVATSNKPMLMLATSKDHTLFGPIYTDFEDLDGDGVIDTTFKPDFKYYGYFDSTKCYTYQNSRFEPATIATTASTAKGTRYVCGGSGQWSGNFMNWATMTRLDVIRKMLYGGKRSTDAATVVKSGSGEITAVTGSMTVLERANLSRDSHSFVKYYRGTDVRDYTPFTTADLTKATGSNANTYAGLSICNRSTVMGEGGDPVIRVVKGSYRMWATVEGEVCKWGQGDLGPKLARYFKDADKGNGVIAHEDVAPQGARDGAYGSEAASELTVRVQVCKPGMLGDERCMAVPEHLTSNYKPFGIFQEFGLARSASLAARAEFGVITGSYDKNTNAGALRKNMGDFADEINMESGIFCHSAGGSCSGNTADGRPRGGGAIQSIDNFVLFGRDGGGYGSQKPLPKDLTDGTLPAWGNPIGEMVVQALQYYAGVAQTNPPGTSKDTSKNLVVKSWADPLSNANAVRRGLYGNAVCRPMYTMALSSSALSFDGAKGAADDTQATTAFGTLFNKKKSLSAYTDDIGQAEGLNGTMRSVGTVDGTFGQSCSGKTVSTLSKVSGICPDAPGMGGTYQVAGAALYGNTSKIRNIATPPPDLNMVQDALKVKTLTASLTGGAARIEVPIPGTNPRKYVYITPESLWNGGGDKKMPGALLTFDSIATGSMNIPATDPDTVIRGKKVDYGTFVVSWNDAQMGGDYDMDIAGFIRYDVYPDTASPSGYSIRISTDILNVGAGDTGTHGFSVMGTNNDRRYLTHRHNDNDGSLAGLTDGTDFPCLGNTNSAGSECRVGSAWNVIRNNDYPVRKYFQMKGVDNVLVQDPLWYAAKYGYFASSVRNPDGTFAEVAMPNSQESWDRLKADGTSGSDGVPDGYFLARRPDILEAQLRKALDAMVKSSNAAPAISAAQLMSNEFKYVAKFDSTTISGTLEAYKVDSKGYFEPLYTWEAGRLLHDQHSGSQGNARHIITNSAGAGSAFRWGSLPTAYKTQLTTASGNVLSASHAEKAVNYIRGDQTLEGVNGLRPRESNLLGPLISGTPFLQGPPSAAYYGAAFAGYAEFAGTYKNRDSLLWVPSNDGMLHAFDSKTGAEKIAYVPGALANRLAEIPLQRGTTARTKISGVDYTTNLAEEKPDGLVWAYVDGSPFIADVNIGTSSDPQANKDKWRTYAFGTLGRGGKAIYALDVTNVAGLAESNAANIFKWQFTSDDDEDLGYITSDPAMHRVSNQALPVVKMNNGKFAVIFGNGNKSKNGKAVLYVLYVQGSASGTWTASSYKKLVADAAPGGKNGLSAPRWEDYDGNGTADVIYAGDLQGNMWKFSVSSSNPDDWGLAGTAPLFRATYSTTVDGQTTVRGLPITTAPTLLYMGSGGLMVNFATGNAFERTDFGNGEINRVYGVWDRPGRTGTIASSRLVQRQATRHADGRVTLQGQTANWGNVDGWYWDLPANSEAVLSNPELLAGVIYFTAVRPVSAEVQAVACNASPNAALYVVDPISGKAERNVLGTVPLSGVITPISGSNTGDQRGGHAALAPGERPFKEVPCNAGEPGCVCKDGSCSRKERVTQPGERCYILFGSTSENKICYNSAPRMQWREIPGLRTFVP